MKAFNEYINLLRERKIPRQTIDVSTMRVGRLKVEAKFETSEVRFLYNNITIIPYIHVKTGEDIISFQRKSLDMLKNAEVDLEDFADVLLDKYYILKEKYKNVLIIDLYTEITGKKFDKNKDWSFIYNIDLYNHSYRPLDKKKLIFETGSQSETEKIGVTLNGLFPDLPYKKFCYVSL